MKILLATDDSAHSKAAVKEAALSVTTAVIDGSPKSAILEEAETFGATKTYTCSMHPEVITDKPGKCPKCGMELIEKK